MGAEAAPPESGVALVSTIYQQAELVPVADDGSKGESRPASANMTVGAVVTYVTGSWQLAGFGS